MLDPSTAMSTSGDTTAFARAFGKSFFQMLGEDVSDSPMAQPLMSLMSNFLHPIGKTRPSESLITAFHNFSLLQQRFGRAMQSWTAFNGGTDALADCKYLVSSLLSIPTDIHADQQSTHGAMLQRARLSATLAPVRDT